MELKNIKLKTSRCTIVPMKRKYIPEIFEVIKDNYELTKHMLWEPYSHIEESYRIWDKAESLKKEDYSLVIFCENKFAGRISVRNINYQDKSANFGFWIAPAFQGQGIGTEVLREIARFVFEDLGMEKLTGESFLENIISQKVQERVGFKKVGYSKDFYEKRGVLVDEIKYELLKKDFLPCLSEPEI